jgi:uncharacterized protein YbjT (DUF2867 family)
MNSSDSRTPILVTGGTGTLGRHLIPQLLARGESVRVLSRQAQPTSSGVEYVVGDLQTGVGVREALRGITTILHAAGSQKGDGNKARSLIEHATTASVRHFVYISVVGCDRIPVVSAIDRASYGYFAEKRAAELAIERSGIPWTILRATQFHELALLTARTLARLPLVPYFGGVSFQPVAATDVASELARLAVGEPAELVNDIGGPQVFPMRAIMRDYLHSIGSRRALFPIRTPGHASRAMQAGANLTPDRAVGVITWADFLAKSTDANDASS